MHGSIAVQWVDFANDAERGLKSFKDDPHHLRLDPDAPVLYLNSGFDGLEALLGDRKRRPRAEQAMHDSTRVNIASDAWQAMFVTALDAVEVDPETGMPEWPARSGGLSCSGHCSRGSTRTSDRRTPLSRPSRPAARRRVRENCWSACFPPPPCRSAPRPLLRRGIALLEKDTETKESSTVTGLATPLDERKTLGGVRATVRLTPAFRLGTADLDVTDHS